MKPLKQRDAWRPTEVEGALATPTQGTLPMAPHEKHRDEVERRAMAILRASPYMPVQRLDCTHADGVLRVSGRVPRFYLKQHALMLAKKVPGVYRIDDQIEVQETAAETQATPARQQLSTIDRAARMALLAS